MLIGIFRSNHNQSKPFPRQEEVWPRERPLQSVMLFSQPRPVRALSPPRRVTPRRPRVTAARPHPPTHPPRCSRTSGWTLRTSASVSSKSQLYDYLWLKNYIEIIDTILKDGLLVLNSKFGGHGCVLSSITLQHLG